MSILSNINRIKTARNTIAGKFVEMGLAKKTQVDFGNADDMPPGGTTEVENGILVITGAYGQSPSASAAVMDLIPGTYYVDFDVSVDSEFERVLCFVSGYELDDGESFEGISVSLGDNITFTLDETTSIEAGVSCYNATGDDNEYGLGGTITLYRLESIAVGSGIDDLATVSEDISVKDGGDTITPSTVNAIKIPAGYYKAARTVSKVSTDGYVDEAEILAALQEI